MKFRVKPTMIEAEQWFPGKIIEGVWVEKHFLDCAYIHTLEGFVKVIAGDWIITAMDGKKHACKPDVFEKTYEREPEDIALEAVARHEQYYHDD
jgi:hypothetical protein